MTPESRVTEAKMAVVFCPSLHTSSPMMALDFSRIFGPELALSLELPS